jgi:hypothetical protein
LGAGDVVVNASPILGKNQKNVNERQKSPEDRDQRDKGDRQVPETDQLPEAGDADAIEARMPDRYKTEMKNHGKPADQYMRSGER